VLQLVLVLTNKAALLLEELLVLSVSVKLILSFLIHWVTYTSAKAPILLTTSQARAVQ
jgi:hypothetical protein